MIGKIILGGLLAFGAASLPALADVNSPDAAGYIDRAATMYAAGNYAGCIDQAAEAIRLNPTPDEAEKAEWLRAAASLRTGDSNGPALVAEFLRRYPATRMRPEAIAATGDYWFGRHNYSRALDFYKSAGRNDFNTARADEVAYRKAYSEMMLSRTASAAAGFSTLLKSRTYRNAALFYLGYLAYYDSDYDRAIDYFSQADPSREPATAAEYYLSQIYFLRGDYRKALNAAKASLGRQLEPEFRAEANRIAGESLYGLHEDSEAVGYLLTYVDMTDEPLPSALYILGLDAFHEGDYHGAIAYLQGATTPDDAMGQSAWLYLGQAYVKTGNVDAALMAFEKAYRQRFDPAVTETAFYNYAVARLEGGRIPFGSSVGLFEEFLSRYPDSRYAPKVQEYIVNGYLADNDYEAALESISKMRNPTKASIAARQRALFLLAVRQYGAGNTAEAKRNFLSTRSIDASADIRRQADLWLGDCYYREGDYKAARKSYEAFIKKTPADDPNYTQALYNLAYAEFSEEDYTAAASSLNRALRDAAGQMTPTLKADAYGRLGDCMYYQHRFDDAAAEYRRAYDANPSSGDYALYQLAVMKGLDGHHKEKISSLNALMKEFPSSALAPAALLEQAESYAALDDNGRAEEVCGLVIDRYPSTAYARRALLQRAITRMGRGQRDNAISDYRRVVSTYPSSDEARIATDDLKRIYADSGELDKFAAFIGSIDGAPQIDFSELETLAYEAAEKDYLDTGSTARLESYTAGYPRGSYRPQALFYIAEARFKAGDLPTALSLTGELLQRYPDSDVAEDALLVKADSELAEGKCETALATFRDLERRASTPRNLARARMGILNVAQVLDMHQAAVDAADKLLATSAGGFDADEVHFLRGLSLAALHEYSDAESEWRPLAKNPSGIYGARSAVHLAALQLERGELKSARKTIDSFLDSDTPHIYWQARGFITLSDILRAEGKTFEADEYLKSLRTNYPGNEPDIFEMISQRLGSGK